jgi:hypothetical protein
MKRFMLTVVLTCFLSVSVLAGEMPTAGIVDPPPRAVSCETPQSDDEATDTSTESAELSDLLTKIILELITWP